MARRLADDLLSMERAQREVTQRIDKLVEWIGIWSGLMKINWQIFSSYPSINAVK